MNLKQYEPNLYYPLFPRWTRVDLESDRKWLYKISPDILLETERVFRKLNINENNWQTVLSLKKKILDSTSSIGRDLKTTLFDTHGFILINKLPCPWFENGWAKLFYALLCLELGDLDLKRGPFYEVFDRGKDNYYDNIRYSDTNLSHGFHTDSTALELLPDIVGLMCFSPSLIGGETRLVNMNEVHEILKTQFPSLLRRLYKEMIRDRKSSIQDNSHKQELIDNRYPVFSRNSITGGITFRYMRRWIELGHQKAEINLEEEDLKALDKLEEIMNSENLVFMNKLQGGEILFFNNHIIAHDRTQYLDDPANPRLMIRAWITSKKR